MPATPTVAELAAATAQQLGALSSAFAIDWIEECDSTNRVLAERPPAADERIAVLVANRQSGGRGRRGRQWLSWSGGSLTFSLRWRFAAGAPVPGGLSLVAGLAVARALDTFGARDIALKWPNDVLHRGNKLAGILVELSSARGCAMTAVIGIGINVRVPADAQVGGHNTVGDLASVLAVPPSSPQLLAAILIELQRLLELYASAGFAGLRTAWEQRHAFAGQRVRVSSENMTVDGECAGVDEDGALLLRDGTGTRRILAGDVSLRPLAAEAS